MDWLTWIFYSAIALTLYSLLVIPVLMELSLNTPKRNSAGLLRIDQNSWVIRDCYRGNFWEETRSTKRTLPCNICEFYWGLWKGVPVAIFSSVFCGVVGLAIYVFCVPAGFLPNSSPKKEYPNLLHKYQRYGPRDEKEWIAPWKVLLPLSLLAFAIFFPAASVSVVQRVLQWFAGNAPFIIKIGKCTAIIAPLVGIIFALVWAKNRIKKSEFWAAAKDWLESIKDHACIRTTTD